MSWRVIYIEESDKLSLYLDNMKVIKNDEDILIPISDIHTVILDNYKINLSVHLINALTKANVNLVICGIDHLPKTIVIPYSGHKLSFSMLQKQLDWDKTIKEVVHKFIVENKIKNQKMLLKYFKKENYAIQILKKHQQEVTLADKTNREGLAAKCYFNALFGSEFKRFNNDVINAGLNYGYAILRSQISKVLIAKGLNTSIGFFHIGRENEFNLSDDIIEPFRPLVDYWVHSNLLGVKMFLKEHRLALIKSTTKKVKIDGKYQTLFNGIQIFVEAILNFCETRDEKTLRVVTIDYDEL